MEVRVHFEITSALDSFPTAMVIGEETRDSPEYSFSGATRRERDHVIFQYTLQGAGMFRDANGSYVMDAGKGFLCRARDPRTAYWYPEDAGQDWHFIYFTLIGDTALAMASDFIERHGAIYPAPLDEPFIQQLLRVVRGNERVQWLSAPENAELVIRLFKCLLSGRLRNGEQNARQALVNEVRKMVDKKSAAGKVSVTEIARNLRISREHLSRSFATGMGMTLRAYLERQRLLKAITLLRESHKSIKEIAADLDYSTSAHFARAFRRSLGSTPQQYRRALHPPLL